MEQGSTSQQVNGAARAVHRAVRFLQQRQLPSGEFRTYRSHDPDMIEDCEYDGSPYITTYVLHSLQFADDPLVGAMIALGCSFLSREMIPPGLWSYFSSENPRSLPPDLDDTACASSVLRKGDPSFRPDRNRERILANRDARGLFLTFLGEGPNNVDAVVNANVLLYLGERDETRPAVAFLNRIVLEEEEAHASLYGVGPLSLYYVISRATAQACPALGESSRAILTRIARMQRQDGSFGNDLDTGLAVATMHNLGEGEPETVDRAVAHLLGRQGADGSWSRCTFYKDFLSSCYGSEELTTALCLEAVARTVSRRQPARARGRRGRSAGDRGV